MADALRRRLGPTEVFLDNRTIGLGQAFAKILRDGVRGATVFIALIGPRWGEPPLRERLHDSADWVRQEILLAYQHRTTIIPVLVDRPTLPETATLPDELRFLTTLQAAVLRQPTRTTSTHWQTKSPRCSQPAGDPSRRRQSRSVSRTPAARSTPTCDTSCRLSNNGQATATDSSTSPSLSSAATTASSIWYPDAWKTSPADQPPSFSPTPT